jgi:DNA polymerase-3 subunit alpha
MGEDCPVRDEQMVNIAGIVQAVKMKSTRNNSMMAYVTVEDDTASMEMLAFSNVLNQYGGYLKENNPVVITGRLSLRDDKDPQIVINRVRPMSDFETQNQLPEQPEVAPVAAPKPQILSGKLYLKLPSEMASEVRKVKAIINMFPGESDVVLYFADTQKRRGTRCMLAESMLRELKNVLGEGNVVLK